MTDPWSLVNASGWLLFVVWAVAIHLCHQDPA